MATSPSRQAGCLAVTIAVALLISGCAGQTAKPTTRAGTTTAAPTATSTLTATTTAAGPLTDSELAWLDLPTKLRQMITKVATRGSSNLTRPMLDQWVGTLRSCSRALARLGAPSARVQPVYVLVKQACQQYDKGAACFAEAAPFLDSVTRIHKVQQALDCGAAAMNKGSELLVNAEAKGIEIRSAG
jgi:hypothetical protein